jgi:hypothetical protein
VTTNETTGIRRTQMFLQISFLLSSRLSLCSTTSIDSVEIRLTSMNASLSLVFVRNSMSHVIATSQYHFVLDMNKMNDHHRYYPYYRAKHYSDRRHDNDDSNDYKRYHKKNSSYSYSYASSRRDERPNNRNYRELPFRRAQRFDYRYSQQTARSKNYTCFSSPPPSLLSISIPHSGTSASPVHTPPTLLNIVPHERESWIRSVKKTKTNESTEQKTQYLETMLRMPQQQKSTLNSSKFDRMRFADDPSLTTTIATSTATESTITINTDQRADTSFHLIGDVHDHRDICTLEKILFDHDLANEPEKTIDESSCPTISFSTVRRHVDFLTVNRRCCFIRLAAAAAAAYDMSSRHRTSDMFGLPYR